jgi:hypothetical protein
LISMTVVASSATRGARAADLGVRSMVELHASEPASFWYIQQQIGPRHDLPSTL